MNETTLNILVLIAGILTGAILYSISILIVRKRNFKRKRNAQAEDLKSRLKSRAEIEEIIRVIEEAEAEG